MLTADSSVRVRLPVVLGRTGLAAYVTDAEEALAAAARFGYPVVVKPTLGAASNFVFRVDDEAQLRDNLGAVGWSLSPDQIARLDKASAVMPAYPYYPYRIQEGFARINPPPV